MNLQNLSPLPSQRSETDCGSPFDGQDSFVDDEVVLALVTGSAISRSAANPNDLALAADDMDFAGWSLSSALPDRSVRAEYAPDRRAAPPELEEPGIGEPHKGSHRWWLAGLAGALSTMIFTLVLIAISNRRPPDVNVITVIRPQPSVPALPNTRSSDSKLSAEITGMTPEE